MHWRRLARALPPPVRGILETIDVPWLRNDTAEEIERELFGWEERRVQAASSRVPVDPAAVRTAWRGRLTTRPDETLAQVRRIVDENKRTAHYSKVQDREIGRELLPHHQDPTPKDGVLVVRPPPHRRNSYFGVSGYLEATPVEIPVYVARFWQRRIGRTSPAAWDLTAGGNTVAEVLTTVFGSRVVASDIVATDALAAFGDLRDVGFLAHHRGNRRPAEILAASVVVTTPDLVFIDPPSRGGPSHSALYLGDRPELDLACLDRDEYLANILAVLVLASARLARGGLLSLLLREGVRSDQRVGPDESIVTDFLTAAADFPEVMLVDRFRLVEPAPVRQASLATTRPAMTHLLFARAQ
jgi:hypothetical protein